jgi:hypothetical protein
MGSHVHKNFQSTAGKRFGHQTTKSISLHSGFFSQNQWLVIKRLPSED